MKSNQLSVTSMTIRTCFVLAFLFVACGGPVESNKQEMLKRVTAADDFCPPWNPGCETCNGCRLGLTLCYGIGVTTCSSVIGGSHYRMTCTGNGWTSDGSICNGTETL